MKKNLLILVVAAFSGVLLGCGAKEEPADSTPPAGSSAAPAGTMNTPAQSSPNSVPPPAQMK